MVALVSLTLPNSREMETKADRIGLELMSLAGYHPGAAATLWQKMGRLYSTNTPTFLRTHPPSAAREADMREHVPEVLPLYEAEFQSLANRIASGESFQCDGLPPRLIAVC